VPKTEGGGVEEVNVNGYLRCDTQKSEVVGWRVYTMWPDMPPADTWCALSKTTLEEEPTLQNFKMHSTCWCLNKSPCAH
jgi:hypothetical protein